MVWPGWVLSLFWVHRIGSLKTMHKMHPHPYPAICTLSSYHLYCSDPLHIHTIQYMYYILPQEPSFPCPEPKKKMWLGKFGSGFIWLLYQKWGWNWGIILTFWHWNWLCTGSRLMVHQLFLLNVIKLLLELIIKLKPVFPSTTIPSIQLNTWISIDQMARLCNMSSDADLSIWLDWWNDSQLYIHIELGNKDKSMTL